MNDCCSKSKKEIFKNGNQVEYGEVFHRWSDFVYSLDPITVKDEIKWKLEISETFIQEISGAEFASILSSRIADNLSRFSNLELNYDVPKIGDYIPKRNNYDMTRIQIDLQMALDANAAQQSFEMWQLQEGLERNTQVLEKILSQGIVLDDGEFTRRYQHAATEYRRMSGRELGLY